MKLIENPSLSKNPNLIIPDDSVTLLVITAKPNKEWIIDPDILDIALSYSMSGKDVVLQLKFEDIELYNIENIMSTAESASVSLSLLPPVDKKDYQKYSDIIIKWYVSWSEHQSFSQIIYTIVPYMEYLIALNWSDGSSTDLMESPSDEYSSYFKGLLPEQLTNLFKNSLRLYIEEFNPEVFELAKEALIEDMNTPQPNNTSNQFISTGNVPPFPLIFI
jgi:hypothetical protein